MSLIIGTIVVLGILIFIHELGHFIFCKVFGVGVERFSLGFGPKILSKTVGPTEYCLSAIPLGGYVKMVGEQPGTEIDAEDIDLSFTHKSVVKRVIIVAAGPVFNFLLAIFIYLGIFTFVGIEFRYPTVGNVTENYPAEAAGLKPGDRILMINQTPISNWSDIATLIAGSDGGSLEIKVQRDTDQLLFQIVPREETEKNIFGEDFNRYVIGISDSGNKYIKHLGVGEALKESIRFTYMIIELTFLTIVKIFQGIVSLKDAIGGPIFIVQMAGEQAEKGFVELLYFIAYISVSLGILNLLPIPVLDGGHIVFFSIEAVIGRPVNIRIREVSQQVFFFLLMLLMVFVIYIDIMRKFNE